MQIECGLREALGAAAAFSNTRTLVRTVCFDVGGRSAAAHIKTDELPPLRILGFG